jgi:predicted nucleic acid-binding protein
MSEVVVDASVALKWLIEEEYSDAAASLMEDSLNVGTVIVGPPHLPGEVANALYRRMQRSQNSITRPEAEEALATFLALPIQIISSQELYARAFAFALHAGLSSLYDSIYVVLAQLMGVELWTDDRRLLSVLARTAPWVRAIGDY